MLNHHLSHISLPEYIPSNEQQHKLHQLFTSIEQKISQRATKDKKLEFVQQMKRIQEKVFSILNSYKQSHLSCLQQIQILLYQRDYQRAKIKISELKTNPLLSSFALSCEKGHNQFDNSILSVSQFKIPHFQALSAAKLIIQDQNTTFQQKQSAWLSCMMSEDEQIQQMEGPMHHICIAEIQQAKILYSGMIQSGLSQFTEQMYNQSPKQQSEIIYTPIKMMNKSGDQLKSNQKLVNKSKQKSFTKISNSKMHSSNKKSNEKKTAKKVSNADGSKISKTNKKNQFCKH